MSAFASEARAKAPPPIKRRLRLESIANPLGGRLVAEPGDRPGDRPREDNAGDNDTVRLLARLLRQQTELRQEVKDLKYKQTEMMQKMGESDQVLRYINERGQQPSDEDLRGLNLEEVVEKLHVCCSTSMEIMCFLRSTVYARD